MWNFSSYRTWKNLNYPDFSYKKKKKIVTKDGNLILKAGEDGDIVFEPGQGKQVIIGGNVLVRIRPFV